MLFAVLPSGTVYVRVERSRYAVVVDGVELAATVQRARDFDHLHLAMAALYGLVAVLAVVLAIVYRDRGLWLFAVYFAFPIINEVILTGVAQRRAEPQGIYRATRDRVSRLVHRPVGATPVEPVGARTEGAAGVDNEPTRMEPGDIKLASFHLSRMIRSGERK